MGNRSTRVSKSLTQKNAKLMAEQAERNQDLKGAIPAATLESEAGSGGLTNEEIQKLGELIPNFDTTPKPAAEGGLISGEGEAQELSVEHEVPAPTVEAIVTGVPVLHVKQGLALRGGRGEWYKL